MTLESWFLFLFKQQNIENIIWYVTVFSQYVSDFAFNSSPRDKMAAILADDTFKCYFFRIYLRFVP